ARDAMRETQEELREVNQKLAEARAPADKNSGDGDEAVERILATLDQLSRWMTTKRPGNLRRLFSCLGIRLTLTFAPAGKRGRIATAATVDFMQPLAESPITMEALQEEGLLGIG